MPLKPSRNYDISYVTASNIDQVISYGYINEAYLELNNNRYDMTNLAIRRFRAFLPIGTRVILKDLDNREIEVLIIARNVINENKEYSDYLGVNTKYGYIGNSYVFNFDKEHIIRVVSLGYFNDQESKFNRELLIDRKILDRR